MAEYTPAPEVKNIANKLIDKYHSHLSEARIICLFRDKPIKSKGKELYGKASKVSSKYNAFTGADFIIEITEQAYLSMEHKTQVALIDHQLSHCFIDIEGHRSILSHDFEGFNSILKRHGFWHSDLQMMKKRLQQMELPFDEEPKLKLVNN